jgi:hypothetical protein
MVEERWQKKIRSIIAILLMAKILANTAPLSLRIF